MSMIKARKFVSCTVITKQDGTKARVMVISDRKTKVQILFRAGFNKAIHSTLQNFTNVCEVHDFT